jgi:hypothetical protein
MPAAALDAVDEFVLGRGWKRGPHRRPRILREKTSQAPVRLLDETARRRRRCLIDTGECQGPRVADGDMPARPHQHDRIVGGHSVELRPMGMAPNIEFGVVVAAREDPLAWTNRGRPRLDCGQQSI